MLVIEKLLSLRLFVELKKYVVLGIGDLEVLVVYTQQSDEWTQQHVVYTQRRWCVLNILLSWLNDVEYTQQLLSKLNGCWVNSTSLCFWRGGVCCDRAVVLVDLALGLRSFRSCGTGGLGEGGGGGSPKGCGCPRGRYTVGRKALGTMTGVFEH